MAIVVATDQYVHERGWSYPGPVAQQSPDQHVRAYLAVRMLGSACPACGVLTCHGDCAEMHAIMAEHNERWLG